MQLWQSCLLVTARSLYMFRTLSASIIRSTKNCRSSHWCMSWLDNILSLRLITVCREVDLSETYSTTVMNLKRASTLYASMWRCSRIGNDINRAQSRKRKMIVYETEESFSYFKLQAKNGLLFTTSLGL